MAHNLQEKLISKNVGGKDIGGLQKVDYGYNIRGWLKNINNIDNLNNNDDPVDLFAFKINYDTVENDVNHQVTALYNGNISESFWKTASDNTPRKYGYQYDNLNRLTNSIYQKPGMPVSVTNSYNESMKYDKNGNIMALQRNGNLDVQDQTLLIDNLIYRYFDNSNQLYTVTDAAADPNGFTDDSTDGDPSNDGQDYYYDANGNMIEDDNKSIDYIQYNHLNLPTEIGISNSDVGTIYYIYDATGKKVQKEVDDDTLGTGVVTDYLDGFQYKDDILQFFPTAEGYVNCNAPKIMVVTSPIGVEEEKLVLVDEPKSTFSYVYNYLDHLGNIRLSYSRDPQTGNLRIIEENHYYPFGLKHANYNSGKNIYIKEMEMLKIKPLPPLLKTSYSFKFEGRELQDELGLNVYPFRYRTYDPALGRFWSVDPVAENYPHNGVYNFAENRVVESIDLEGKESWFVQDGSQATHTTPNTLYAGPLTQSASKKAGLYSPSEIQQMKAKPNSNPKGPMFSQDKLSSGERKNQEKIAKSIPISTPNKENNSNTSARERLAETAKGISEVAETTSTTTKITAVVGGVAAVVTGNLELLPAAVDLYEGGVTIGGIGQGAKATSLYAEGKSTEANMEAASIFASSVTGSWINTIPGLSEVTKVTAKTITDKAIETGKDKLKEELNKE